MLPGLIATKAMTSKRVCATQTLQMGWMLQQELVLNSWQPGLLAVHALIGKCACTAQALHMGWMLQLQLVLKAWLPALMAIDCMGGKHVEAGWNRSALQLQTVLRPRLMASKEMTGKRQTRSLMRFICLQLLREGNRNW